MSTFHQNTAGQPPAEGAVDPRPRMTVLFVDPDQREAWHLAETLRDRCVVGVVGSAGEALAAMRQRMPTMVVTELDLPDASGLQLIASLRNTPATHNVLLMVVTFRASIHEKIAALEAGADDYLVKPVNAALFQTHALLVSRFRQVLPR